METLLNQKKVTKFINQNINTTWDNINIFNNLKNKKLDITNSQNENKNKNSTKESANK